MQLPAIELDTSMKDLIAHSHSVCSQAATSIINLAGQTKLQDFLATSPITSIYSVFQAALISLYNVTQGSTTDQATVNLRRSMDFLLQRQNLTVVSRVIEILKLLTALNGISEQSILSPPTERDGAGEAPSSNHTKQKQRNRPHTASSTLSKSARFVEPKIEEMDTDFAKQVFARNSIPVYPTFPDDPENEMPKAQWIQRIMSTTVVGGISPELQPSMQAVLAPNPSSMMPGSQPGLMDSFSSPMLSNLDTSQRHAAPMAIRSPDSNFRPWNHQQMLPQSYYPYPMVTETFAATGEQTSRSVSDTAYQPPFNGVVPSQSAVQSSNVKVDNNGSNMATTSQTMFQDQPPSMLNMMQTQQELQDMRTNMPPSSLNWEDWDSYVNQEISRTQ